MTTSQITLNLTQGSVRFNFSLESAQALKADLSALMTSLKAIAVRTSEGAQRVLEPELDYRHTGEVFLEVFCNPNIWPSPFAAKVLVTLRDDRIRLTTETDLAQLYDDLNTYLEQS